VRNAATARPAQPDDFPRVVEILRMARADSPLGPQLCSPDSELLAEQLNVWYGRPSSTLSIAEVDDEVVGIALLEHVDVNLFSDVAYLHVEALFVVAEHRRRGVGRALMQQIALVAAQTGAERVVTMPISGSRSEQRFLSGLGFSPVATRRIAETGALLRRLEQLAAPRRSKGIEELIARRRRSRGLPPTPAGGLALQTTPPPTSGQLTR
jgi:GNAT superfamily N-acetyltransferase